MAHECFVLSHFFEMATFLSLATSKLTTGAIFSIIYMARLVCLHGLGTLKLCLGNMRAKADVCGARSFAQCVFLVYVIPSGFNSSENLVPKTTTGKVR